MSAKSIGSSIQIIIPLISLLTACGGESPDAGRHTSEGGRNDTASATAPPFSLQSTTRCLLRRGMTIDRKPPTDPRLRAVRDLAQRNSVVVRSKGQAVGVAVTRGTPEAALLRELLSAPGQHRVTLRRNAVLVFRPASEATFHIVEACLRPEG